MKDLTYREYADELIDEMQHGERLHGGSFNYLLTFDDAPYNAARVYQKASQLWGPFATAEAFAAACNWEIPSDAAMFVDRHQGEWPPVEIAEELASL